LKPSSGLCRTHAAGFKERKESEAVQDDLSATADEFAADAMPGVRTGFVQGDRDADLPEANAEGQSGQSPADDDHGLHEGARLRVAEKP